MKKFINFSILSFIILLLVALPVSAHSGGTDANGGHYDSKTGEYHYHHGYSAHQHPNGVCPYAYDAPSTTKATTRATTRATTKATTRATTRITTKKTTEKTEPEALSGTSTDPTFSPEQSEAYEKGYNEGYEEGLSASTEKNDTSLSASPHIPDTAAYAAGYNAGYDAAKTEYSNKTSSQSEKADNDAKIHDRFETAIFLLSLFALVSFIVSRVKIKNRNVRIEQLNGELHTTNQQIQKLTTERDTLKHKQFFPQYTGTVALPEGVTMEYECIPVSEKSILYPHKYGRYTVFINSASKKFHRDPSCCPSAVPVHEFTVTEGWEPCKICGGYRPYIPDWYKELIENRQEPTPEPKVDTEIEAPKESVKADPEIEAPEESVKVDPEIEAPEEPVKVDPEIKKPKESVKVNAVNTKRPVADEKLDIPDSVNLNLHKQKKNRPKAGSSSRHGQKLR